MAYEIKNKEEHLKKIREELEHNYCASELNIKFYRDVVIPKKQKVVADEKDKGKLRVATAELTSVQERLDAEERTLQDTEDFLKLLD